MSSSSYNDTVYWLDERFKHPQVIGEGAYGDVYRCYDSQIKSIVAVKQIVFDSKLDGLPSVILREISVLKELDHPKVVRLLDVIAEPHRVQLVLEYLDGTLFRFIKDESKPKKPHLIKDLLFQILQGVSYCHSQKILHRDLKPENLLLDLRTKTIKIADFGHTRAFDVAPTEYSIDVTTTPYKAPELLLSRWQTTTAVDIWAVGCIFAEMVMGNPLFSGNTDDVLTKIICIFGVPSEKEWEGVTADCLRFMLEGTLPPRKYKLEDFVPSLELEGLDLLSKMLCFLPNERITACDALKHPYFEGLQPNH